MSAEAQQILNREMPYEPTSLPDKVLREVAERRLLALRNPPKEDICRLCSLRDSRPVTKAAMKNAGPAKALVDATATEPGKCHHPSFLSTTISIARLLPVPVVTSHDYPDEPSCLNASIVPKTDPFLLLLACTPVSSYELVIWLSLMQCLAPRLLLPVKLVCQLQQRRRRDLVRHGLWLRHGTGASPVEAWLSELRGRIATTQLRPEGVLHGAVRYTSILRWLRLAVEGLGVSCRLAEHISPMLKSGHT